MPAVLGRHAIADAGLYSGCSSPAWSPTTGTATLFEDNQLIRNVGMLDGIPVYSFTVATTSAARARLPGPTSGLTDKRAYVIGDMGHGGGDTFLDAVTTALSRVAGW